MNDEAESSRRPLPVLTEEPLDWGRATLTTFVRVHSRFERRMADALAAHGVTLPQFDVLMTLSHGQGITQQELAERLLVTKGNVVGLIDRLCTAKWVERRADPSDRRVNRLYLTDQGCDRLAVVGPAVVALQQAILRVFTQDELRQMHGLLRRLEESVQG